MTTVNGITVKDWSDVIWFLIGCAIILVIYLTLWKRKANEEENEIRDLYYTPEEKKKLTDHINLN